MRRMALMSVAFLFTLAAAGWAQEEPKSDPKNEKDDDEDQLTPEQAMEMLKDIQGMMSKAEELLNDSSRGKALATEEDLIKKLEKEFKDDPTALQKQILEKVKKLNERTEKKQKDAIDKLAELIKKAKS